MDFNKKREKFEYKFLYLSEIFVPIISSILSNDKCSLPNYNISKQQHLLVHDIFLKFLKNKKINIRI